MDYVMVPMHRLPVETLQEIFKAAVEDPIHLTVLSRLKIANAISHVDRYWRLIALGTRCLWVNIWMRLDRSSETIEEYWTWARERVQDQPLRIEIWCPASATLDKLPWNFKALPNIDFLRFTVEDVQQLEKLFQDNFQVPSCAIEELYMQSDDWNLLHYHQSLWLSNRKLAKWPPIRRLGIKGEFSFGIDTGIQMSATTELYISTKSPFHFGCLAVAFSNLEKLSVGALPWISTYSAPATFDHLKEIALTSDAIGSFLAIVHCPSLTTLRISSSLSPENILPFLTRHPTIHTYEAAAHRHMLVGIAAVAPQIQSIYIHEEILHPFKFLNSNDVLFPNLIDLSVNSGWFPLYFDEFNTFIRQRCLSTSNPDSRIVDNKIYTRIQTLSIKCIREPRWRSSEVLRSAKQTTMTSGNDMKQKWVVKLEWK